MRGIPLYVGSSWVVIAVLFVFIQYSNLTDSERVTGVEALLLSAFITVLFFGSVLLHEAAHAAMARGLDLPVMGITLVFWGGATETEAAARGAKGEFLVALVGPATTLALGGVFWVAGTLTQGVISDVLDWLAGVLERDLRRAEHGARFPVGRWSHAARDRVGDHREPPNRDAHRRLRGTGDPVSPRSPMRS